MSSVPTFPDDGTGSEWSQNRSHLSQVGSGRARTAIQDFVLLVKQWIVPTHPHPPTPGKQCKCSSHFHRLEKEGSKLLSNIQSIIKCPQLCQQCPPHPCFPHPGSRDSPTPLVILTFLSLLLEQHQPFLFFLTLMFLKKQGQLSRRVSHIWIYVSS